ncbi:hypothetical protein [Streptomyces sp. Isolate_219]|uniref:hypothetical protein n=1 Tax=Streptomyces sp. Isolate_219 TaxID=2950110 RepID=UPI0021C8C153|nr:hypothetical protein [Streptomyces sp. Isolate_219]MCR8576630.1 hypothetical protein [Streptomyces sp. Isolate_219]
MGPTGTAYPHPAADLRWPRTRHPAVFPDDTQAYGRDFAALNAADRLLNRACTIGLTGPAAGLYTGTFDFVITTTV